MAEEGYRVTLNVYDLSQGLARQLSASFLGKVIEGIWHTGVVVYGNEYYFGGGIQHCPAGSTPYGTPIRVVELGTTHIPKDVFERYLEEISPRYTVETYNILRHNCNNFSNEVTQFLVGTTIPDYIMQLPNDVMSSPMGPLIMPMFQQLESTLRNGVVPQAPQFRPNPVVSLPSVSTTTESTKFVRSERKTTSCASMDTDLNAPTTKKDEMAPVVEPVGGSGREKVVPVDPMGNARNKVQEEITREFAAIMASGTLRASEAAALATKRVMERYGSASITMPQS